MNKGIPGYFSHGKYNIAPCDVSRLILHCEPEDCLYIGDSDSNELTGATRAGMDVVLIRNPEEDRDNVYRENFEGDTLQGPVITSLREVMDLL